MRYSPRMIGNQQSGVKDKPDTVVDELLYYMH
jgi:hypothetical protein